MGNMNLLQENIMFVKDRPTKLIKDGAPDKIWEVGGWKKYKHIPHL